MHLKEKYGFLSLAKNPYLCNIFRDRYLANYNFLYDMEDYWGIDTRKFALFNPEGALDAGLKFLGEQASDGQFNAAIIANILHDTCVSDREIRALAFTLEEFDVIEF